MNHEIQKLADKEAEEAMALCVRLHAAALILGPTDEGMACIEAQLAIMKPFNDEVKNRIAALKTGGGCPK